MRLNGSEIAQVNAADVPCELTPSRRIEPNASVEFEDISGRLHVHSLGDLSGWAHFSLRVHAGLTCQADCAVTVSEKFDSRQLMNGEALGVRFQPFFLPGSTGDADKLRGQGLFARGMHFNGSVTPGSVRLSCECDQCGRSFQVQSFHAGFSDASYMYSGSGLHTLILQGRTPGAPPALGAPDMKAVEAFEELLPLAPDGTKFRYGNPFRCPHCGAPYIDFSAHPRLREAEYYGNYLYGSEPAYFPPREADRNAAPRGWLRRMLRR